LYYDTVFTALSKNLKLFDFLHNLQNLHPVSSEALNYDTVFKDLSKIFGLLCNAFGFEASSRCSSEAVQYNRVCTDIRSLLHISFTLRRLAPVPLNAMSSYLAMAALLTALLGTRTTER